MKWLFILTIFLILAAFLVVRYRRHIQTAVQVWRMFRQFKRVRTPETKEIKKPKIDQNAPLVRCAKCGKWIAQSEALYLRSKTFYCSTVCMEKAARIESLIDR